MQETLLLAALLSSPSFVTRDQATGALSAGDVPSLTILDALTWHPDHEVAMRADLARGAILRREAEACLRGSGRATDEECAYWCAEGRWLRLDSAGRRLELLPEPHYGGPWDCTSLTPAERVRAFVGWCRSQNTTNPLPWSVTWATCVNWTLEQDVK